MEATFLNILNLSITAGYIILAVIVLRLLMKKAPKWIMLVLWGFVGIRLICPLSFESVFSIIPSAETVSPVILSGSQPAVKSGIGIAGSAVNPIIDNTDSPPAENAPDFVKRPADDSVQIAAPVEKKSINTFQLIIKISSIVWIIGMIGILIYAAVSYVRLRRQIFSSVLYKDNIWQSEAVASPFVLGLFRPKIYIPFNVDGEQYECIMAHEKSHIKHLDHILKPIGFIILTVHWFNPLVWAAYILFCRDIELACDERVVRNMDENSRKSYATALLEYSIEHKRGLAYPLAFGETGVKTRVKSVMNYKKTTFLVVIVSVAVCTLLSACFMTNPVSGETSSNAAAGNKESSSSNVVPENMINAKLTSAVWFESKNGSQPGTESGHLAFNEDKTGTIVFNDEGGDGGNVGVKFNYEISENSKILLTQTERFGNIDLPEEWKEILADFEMSARDDGKPLDIMNVTLKNGEKIKFYSEQLVPMDIKDVSSYITSSPNWYESKESGGKVLGFKENGKGNMVFAAGEETETVTFKYEISANGKMNLTQIDKTGGKNLPEEWKEIWVSHGFLFGEMNSLDLTLKNGEKVSYTGKS